MKRAFLFILATLIVASLPACGNSGLKSAELHGYEGRTFFDILNSDCEKRVDGFWYGIKCEEGWDGLALKDGNAIAATYTINLIPVTSRGSEFLEEISEMKFYVVWDKTQNTVIVAKITMTEGVDPRAFYAEYTGDEVDEMLKYIASGYEF